MDTAKEMIDDWADERINEQDLFFFAFLLTPGLRQIYEELQAEAERQTGESLEGFTSKTAEE